MSEHKYILEPYKGMNTRYSCPSCQQRNKTFSLYINTETGEHIHPTVGRCNRESKCGQHYTPKQYFQDNNILCNTGPAKEYKQKTVTAQPKPVSYISVEVFKQSLQIERNITQVAEVNSFVKYLINLFGVEVTKALVSRYFIATSKHWNGATVFWQIDKQGKIRTGKIMLYNPATGKRIKEPFSYISWVHKAIKQAEFELKQCLFGEHLLIDKTKPVAIVESEKTAIIASVYLPQFIWVAVGSLEGLNAQKCSVLDGRTVALFPDLKCFDKWSNKANQLSQLATFTVSDLLECKATEAERKETFDLADYLIKFNYKDFVLSETKHIDPPPTVQPLVEVKVIEQTDPVYFLHRHPKPECWDLDIYELERYFTGITLLTQTVKLNSCSTITNCSLFIQSHFATVKANNGKRIFLPFLNRLKTLKNLLHNENSLYSI